MKEARADWKRNRAWATYDPSRVTREKLVEGINKKTRFKATLPKKSDR